jgi:hypothetical protein
MKIQLESKTGTLLKAQIDEAVRLSGKFTHIDDDDSKRLEQLRGMFEQGVPDSETIDEWQNTAIHQ